MCLTVRCFIFFYFSCGKTSFHFCSLKNVASWMKVMCKKCVLRAGSFITKVTHTIYPNRSEIPLRFQSCLIHYHKKAVTCHSRRKNLCQSEDIESCVFPNLSFVWILKNKLFPTAFLNIISLEAEVITIQDTGSSWLKSVKIFCWIWWK